jgi:conjugative relaxase-like TrwC/TraI family protein
MESPMLIITASRNAEAAKQYFGKGMVRPDYYIDGQEVTGSWGGKTAERLGLAGEVTQKDYFAVVDNIHPQTGEQLTPRLKDNRRAGYDFTFSAPKSVSAMYELSRDERILAAFRDSTQETMHEIEREMKTRVRRGGKDENRLTGNMAWAEFQHSTSRPVDGIPDPHMHTHMYVPNITWDDKEQRFKAGQFGELKRDAPYFEAAFDARFAVKLNALGYRTEKAGLSFEIAGVPKTVIDKFSRRRDTIEAAAKARGIESAKGKHAIGYYEREAKNNDLCKEELRSLWDAKLSGSERDAMLAVMNFGADDTNPAITAKQALDYAVAHSFERASAVSEKRLKAEALRYGVGSVTPEMIAGAANDPFIIRREVNGEMQVTTQDVLHEEMRMLDFARKGRGVYRPFGNALDGLEGLSDQQRKAAVHVITSRDRVTGIRGAAGTGKTHMMKSVIGAIEHGSVAPSGEHSKVFVFAPSAQASRKVLREEGFKDADTVEHLLGNKETQEKVRGQVLWVDEAGLLSSKDTRRVFELAQKNDCRVILSGDYRQHTAVARGDAFRLLESEAGVKFAELTEIRRQKEASYKEAIGAIAEGTAKDAAKGFDRLDKMGAIIEADDDERHKLLVADYLKAVRDEKSALIIAPTHAEGRALTSEIRETLKETGKLGSKEEAVMIRIATNWTQAQRSDARNYAPGQVIQFHKAVAGERRQKAGVRSTSGAFRQGEAAVVTAQENGVVHLLRQDGSKAELPLANADRFSVYNARELGIALHEKIRITANGYATAKGLLGDRQKRVNNGDIYTVEGFTESGDFRLNNGAVLPRNYGFIAHGYVDTSHASQGKTVDRVFVAVGDESMSAANRAQWYVSVSRGREQVRVYTASKEDLREAIQKSSDRLSAVELVKPPKKAWQRFGSGAFAIERARVSRYLKDRAAVALEYVKSKQRRSEERQYGR